METVFIGIGSNLGNRAENIKKAIAHLKSIPKINVEKISSIIETKPVNAYGPNFLNGVIELTTNLNPEDLLCVLQGIEKKLGRRRTVKNAPRPIDLDILLYGEEIINKPYLKIPHPRMWEREFVLKPLAEIAPHIKKKL